MCSSDLQDGRRKRPGEASDHDDGEHQSGRDDDLVLELQGGAGRDLHVGGVHVLAGLAAGAAVIIKPAPPTPGCVEVAAEAVFEALDAAGVEP